MFERSQTPGSDHTAVVSLCLFVFSKELENWQSKETSQKGELKSISMCGRNEL